MKAGSHNRRILRVCRFRSHRFARIAVLLDYLSAARGDARAAHVVALRFRKPRRSAVTASRTPSRLPWIESRLEQHLHFSIHPHASAAARTNFRFKNFVVQNVRPVIERLRWPVNGPRARATAGAPPNPRPLSLAHSHRAARQRLVPASAGLRLSGGRPNGGMRAMAVAPADVRRPRARMYLPVADSLRLDLTERPGRVGHHGRRLVESAPVAFRTETAVSRRAVPRLVMRTTPPTAPPLLNDLVAASRVAPVRHRVELTYRRSAREGGNALQTEANYPRSAQVSPYTHDIATSPAFRQPATRVSAALVSQSRGLDATVVERLAEDVMRRIDKRARIERERRGI